MAGCACQRVRAYPSDLTDAEWQCLEPHLPPTADGGRPREHDLREIFDALAYLVQTGCGWDYLPHDFPPSGTVYWYLRKWEREGLLETLHDALRAQVRQQAGKEPHPSVLILDSQSVKSTERGGRLARLVSMLARGSKVVNATSWSILWA
jgi:putative transposase